jgi:hypothetical protein
VAQIVANGVSGQQPSHKLGQAHGPAAKEQMRVVAHQRPSINRGTGFLRQSAKPPDKVLAINVVVDNPPLLAATDHHMMQRPRTIEPCLPGHAMRPLITSLKHQGFDISRNQAIDTTSFCEVFSTLRAVKHP